MDPVTAAIISGLVAGVATDTAKIGKKTAIAAYKALMTAIHEKCGINSDDIVETIEHLKKKPDDETLKIALAEKIKDTKVNEDSDLITAAKILQDALDNGNKYHINAENIGVVGGNNQFYGDFFRKN